MSCSKGPPKVEIKINSSNVSYIIRSDGDIMVNVSAYSVSLQCSSDHDVNYTWYLGGVRKGNAGILTLDSVLGTVQCMVTNIWGTTTTSLRILSSKTKNMIILVSIHRFFSNRYHQSSWTCNSNRAWWLRLLYQLARANPYYH